MSIQNPNIHSLNPDSLCEIMIYCDYSCIYRFCATNTTYINLSKCFSCIQKLITDKRQRHIQELTGKFLNDKYFKCSRLIDYHPSDVVLRQALKEGINVNIIIELIDMGYTSNFYSDLVFMETPDKISDKILRLCIINGRLDVLKRLLLKGACPTNEQFIFACISDKSRIVEHFLTDSRIDPTYRDFRAAHLSYKLKNYTVLNALLQDARILSTLNPIERHVYGQEVEKDMLRQSQQIKRTNKYEHVKRGKNKGTHFSEIYGSSLIAAITRKR